jgi:hypothetical protein
VKAIVTGVPVFTTNPVGVRVPLAASATGSTATVPLASAG